MLTRNILGLKVTDVTLDTIVPILQDLIESPGKKSFFCVNPHAINLYNKDEQFKKAMNSASLLYPEGTGTVIASKLLNRPLSGRTNFLDFIFKLLEHAEKKKWPLYILGGEQEVLDKAIKNLKKRFEHLEIHGHHGYFPEENTRQIISGMNRKKPKIVFVALGVPKQEIWVHKYMGSINAKAFFGNLPFFFKEYCKQSLQCHAKNSLHGGGKRLLPCKRIHNVFC